MHRFYATLAVPPGDSDMTLAWDSSREVPVPRLGV